MKTKKLLSMVLAVAMILSITSVAYAESEEVIYLDAAGNEQSCTDYELMANGTDFQATDETWYVVDGNVKLTGKLEINNACIILKDNSTLTVEGGIEVKRNGSLTIYATSADENMGKIVTGYSEYSAEPTSSSLPQIIHRHGIFSYGDITVNGGDISVSVDTEDITMDDPSNSGVEITGIYSQNLTVNAGKIVVNVGDIPDTYYQGYAYGISVNNIMEINGGNVKAVVGSSYCENNGLSYGISSYNLNVNGGSLDVTSGSLDATNGYYDTYCYKITVTGGKIKSLEAFGYYFVELSGGTYEEITVFGGKSLAELVKSGYGYVDEDGNPVDISGLTKISNVKVEKGLFAYSQRNPAAKVVTAEGTNDIETSAELLEALTDEETVSIKLFKSFEIEYDDFRQAGYTSTPFYIEIKSPKLTIDLNGKGLYINVPSYLIPGVDFNITDTGKKQNGVFSVMSIYGYSEDVLLDGLSDYVAPRFTVSGGRLRSYYGIILYGYDFNLSGGKVSIPDSEYGDPLVIIGGSLNVTGGTLDAQTLVLGSKLNITGGKFNGEQDWERFASAVPQSMQRPDLEPAVLSAIERSSGYYPNGIICDQSIGSISGGDFDFLGFSDDAKLSISGGKFGIICGASDEAKVLSTLAAGYAFYDADGGENAYPTDAYMLHNVTVKEHICSFNDEGYCLCGRYQDSDEIATVPDNAIAKVVLRNAFGDNMVIYPTSFEDDFPSGLTIESVTLLKDCSMSVEEWSISNTVTIDLNGHILDVGHASSASEQDYEYSPVTIKAGATVTVKDSSEKKTGAFNVMALQINKTGKLILESGALNVLIESSSINSNVIFGEIEIRGGSFNFENSLMPVMNGRVTVSDGNVEGLAFLLCNMGTINMVSLDDSEDEQPLESASGTGDTMLVTGGKVLSNIAVYPYTSLKVKGGEVGVLATDDETETQIEADRVIYNLGGETYIMGGTIAGFMVGYAEGNGVIEFTGGTFKSIAYSGTELSDMLADNYAYYAKGKKQYDTVICPLTLEESEEQQVYYLEDVQVKEHGCSFDSDGVCKCGRNGTANLKAVKYLDENGNTLYCNNYELVTSETETLASGWYVVNKDVKTNNTIEIIGDAYLILTDGCTLTAKKGIYGSSELSSLTIYGQSDGKNAGKLIATGWFDDYVYSAIGDLYSLTVNSGIVTANGLSFESDYDDSSTSAVYTEMLTVNGGVLNAYGGNVKRVQDEDEEYADAYSYGIYCRCFDMNGGTVNASGGKVETVSRYSYARSYGIYVYNGANITAGTLNVSADNAKVTDNDREDTEGCSVRSTGMYAGELTVNGGKISAKSGEAVLNRPAGIECEDDWAESNAIYVNNYFILEDGTIEAANSKAKNTSGHSLAYTVYFANRMEMTGGELIMTTANAEYACDIFGYNGYIYGGTMRSTRPGGTLKACVYNNFYIYNIMPKFVNSYFERLRTDKPVGTYLEDGYSYYSYDNEDGYTLISIQDTDYGLEETNICRSPITVFVNINDPKGYLLDLSVYADASAENIVYELDRYDTDKITAVCYEEGILKITAKESAAADDVYRIPVWINVDGNYDNYICVMANMKDKISPTVTMTKTTFEKIYDGSELSLSEIVAAATVKDGDETVEGSWEWGSRNESPVNVTSSNETVIFTPQSEDYSPVAVNVQIIIKQVKLSGEPNYNEIEETGKTLKDAKLNANENWPKGTIKWVDSNGGELDSSTEVTAGTSYRWEFCPNDAVNYSKSDGKITLLKQTGNGGGGVSTKKDNTDAPTEDNSETKTEITNNEDGSTTVTETGSNGTTVKTEIGKNGEVKSEITVGKDGESTEITIPTDNSDDITSIIVTDKDGNKREITDFEKSSGGVSFSVSGDCTVELVSGKQTTKKEFKDVHAVGHWAASYIDYVVENGLMNGVSEDEFAPDEKLTRAMLVTVLYRLAGEPEVELSDEFEDVDADGYYAKAVAWAKQNGIISGISANLFAPDENITREQIVTIIYRFAKVMGYDTSVGESTNILSYDDFDDISEYAIEAMQYAVGAGIIQGKTESTLNPREFAERAEVAAILQRFVEANK